MEKQIEEAAKQYSETFIPKKGKSIVQYSFEAGAEWALSQPSNTSLEELQKIIENCIGQSDLHVLPEMNLDLNEETTSLAKDIVTSLLPHLQTKPADELKPVVDTEELKKLYFKHYEDDVEDGDDNDDDVEYTNKFFNWFISNLQPSISVTPKEEKRKFDSKIVTGIDVTFNPNLVFNVCSICGNKRCPHAEDHNFKCTNSNDVGQIGVPIK